jgi:transcriptional regulator with XRE-family HTH domain
VATSVQDSIQLGRTIREARLALGLSQTELARDAQVGRQWLVGLEAGGKTSAPLNMIWRLLRELHLDLTLDSRPVTPLGTNSPVPIISADEVLARHLTTPDWR